eukprot:scaffold26566_cov33-Phaeocystis_antarctica.AAC.3
MGSRPEPTAEAVAPRSRQDWVGHLSQAAVHAGSHGHATHVGHALDALHHGAHALQRLPHRAPDRKARMCRKGNPNRAPEPPAPPGRPQ